MTEISFHFNVPDVETYACALIKKISAKGHKAVVVGSEAVLQALDSSLWSADAESFIGHSHFQSSPATATYSQVILTTTAMDQPHHDVLVNLGSETIMGFERYNKLIEVVTLEDTVKTLARERWKHYSHRGYPIDRFDLSKRR